MRISEKKWAVMARYLAGEMNMNEEITFSKDLKRHPELQSELKQMEKRDV